MLETDRSTPKYVLFQRFSGWAEGNYSKELVSGSTFEEGSRETRNS
jgi:hypothetical protein